MQALNEVVELYSDDLPSPLSVNAEVHMWLVKWLGKEKALKEADLSFFPHPFADFLHYSSNFL